MTFFGEIVAPSSRVKALDELLDLPHLYILLRLILTHLERRPVCSRLRQALGIWFCGYRMLCVDALVLNNLIAPVYGKVCFR